MCLDLKESLATMSSNCAFAARHADYLACLHEARDRGLGDFVGDSGNLFRFFATGDLVSSPYCSLRADAWPEGEREAMLVDGPLATSDPTLIRNTAVAPGV